jgi:hypothetical protein
MALSKKNFISIIFLVAPISLSLYAQSIASADADCKVTAIAQNQKNDIAGNVTSTLENSNQFIVRPSAPTDSFTIAADTNEFSAKSTEKAAITGSYSVLAKDIIENYKYDFSETFIDILFFERIDLARTRTI